MSILFINKYLEDQFNKFCFINRFKSETIAK